MQVVVDRTLKTTSTYQISAQEVKQSLMDYIVSQAPNNFPEVPDLGSWKFEWFDNHEGDMVVEVIRTTSTRGHQTVFDDEGGRYTGRLMEGTEVHNES